MKVVKSAMQQWGPSISGRQRCKFDTTAEVCSDGKSSDEKYICR